MTLLLTYKHPNILLVEHQKDIYFELTRMQDADVRGSVAVVGDNVDAP